MNFAFGAVIGFLLGAALGALLWEVLLKRVREPRQDAHSDLTLGR